MPGTALVTVNCGDLKWTSFLCVHNPCSSPLPICFLGVFQYLAHLIDPAWSHVLLSALLWNSSVRPQMQLEKPPLSTLVQPGQSSLPSTWSSGVWASPPETLPPPQGEFDLHLPKWSGPSCSFPSWNSKGFFVAALNLSHSHYIIRPSPRLSGDRSDARCSLNALF